MPWPWAMGRVTGAVGTAVVVAVGLLLLVTLGAAGGPATPGGGTAASGALVQDEEPTGKPEPALRAVPAPTAGPVRTPARVQVVADRGSVRISGTVASQAAREEIKRKVVAVYGADAVDVSLDVDPAVSDQGVESVADVVNALTPEATGVTVDLSENRVAVQGYVPTEEVHTEVSLALAAVVPDADAVDDGIRVSATSTPTPTTSDDDVEPLTTVPETSTPVATGTDTP